MEPRAPRCRTAPRSSRQYECARSRRALQAALALAVLAWSAPAFAHPTYHPSCGGSGCPAGTVPPGSYDCNFCHVTTGGGGDCANGPCFNPFGLQYYQSANGWMGIASSDADSDNRTNDQERSAGTLPGFPAGAEGVCDMAVCATAGSQSCSNNVDCSSNVNTHASGRHNYTFSFSCRNGASGSLSLTDGNWTNNCTDPNECAGNPCSPGSCTELALGSSWNAPGYDCSSCPAGYADINTNPDECRLVNECAAGTHDCDTAVGATCVDSSTSTSNSDYTCRCPAPTAGYMGDGRTTSSGGTSCQNVEECASDPCAPHDDGSGPNANGCTEHPLDGTWSSPGYDCSCEAGYDQGGSPRTCTLADECTAAGVADCDTSPVAVCNDPDQSVEGDYTCTCPSGYTGDGHGALGCLDIDECSLSLDNCDPNATCTNTPGGFTCTCNAPAWEGDGVTCTNVDECAAGLDDCDPNATCADTVGSFTCTCNAPGWEGDGATCTNVDECARGTDDCDENATCADTPGSFTCTCDEGWRGDGVSCEDVDECADPTMVSRCSTAADCNNLVGSWECVCRDGYRGDGFSCEDIDECAEGAATCDENATCTNAVGSYSCACDEGWVGSGFTCSDEDECVAGSHGCGLNEVCVNQVGAPNECVCAPGTSRLEAEGPCVVVCGDGALGAGEACDDANTSAGDGCSDRCQVEPGWACFEPADGPSECSETCGDGLVDPAEECDDGADNSDTAPDACRTSCALPSCGDGTVDTGEACDEGAGNSDHAVDGCRSTCHLAYCGDGVRDTGEVCDPGGGTPDAVLAGRCTTLCAPDAGVDPEDPPALVGGACRAAPAGRGRGGLILLLAGALALLGRRRRR